MKFLFLLLLFSTSGFAQDIVGVYDSSTPNRRRQVITISENNTYTEREEINYDGVWTYFCTYEGNWSILGDTLVLKPVQVVWSESDITICRPQDDSKQPGCCYSHRYSFDSTCFWNYGPISQRKFVYTKRKN
jgi:hypothetical protein